MAEIEARMARRDDRKSAELQRKTKWQEDEENQLYQQKWKAGVARREDRRASELQWKKEQQQTSNVIN